MRQEERDIKRKLKVLQHAVDIGHVSKSCRYFGISLFDICVSMAFSSRSKRF